MLLNRWLRWIFFVFVVRPVILFGLGLKVRNRHRLPRRGPALIVANHNSHLDTVVLMSLFRLKALPHVRAVAAADYWMVGGFRTWFAEHLIGILPMQRRSEGEKQSLDAILAPVEDWLRKGEIAIFFPEGTRGEPEQLKSFKSGLGHLAERNPTVPVVPVYLFGVGRSLPRGEAFIVPHFIDVFVGEPRTFSGDRKEFVAKIREDISAMQEQHGVDAWA